MIFAIETLLIVAIANKAVSCMKSLLRNDEIIWKYNTRPMQENC
jgi:hypothetical protein